MSYYINKNRSQSADADYMTNSTKRLFNSMSSDFWAAHYAAYAQYCAENKILWRSYHTDADGHYNIWTVLTNETTKDEWVIASGYAEYQAAGAPTLINTGETTDSAGVNAMIDEVMSNSNYSIKHCHPDFRREGMILGDTIDGDEIITV